MLLLRVDHQAVSQSLMKKVVSFSLAILLYYLLFIFTVDSGKPPMKSRVVETEPEPEHKVIDKNGEDLELFLTGEAAYAKYDCPSRLIDFRDTYVLQTKVFR